MEWILPSVLCLSGCLFFSSCLQHQIYYVATPMTWQEAQEHCREQFTDLLTINDWAQISTLNTIPSTYAYDRDVWVGLYKNRTGWKWSDGYDGDGAEFRDWMTNRPANGSCVMAGGYGEAWSDCDCSQEKYFVCTNGTQQNPQFILVWWAVDWSTAQSHCREVHRDLATVMNYSQSEHLKLLVGNEAGSWIGLYRDSGIQWSDGGNSSLAYWRNQSNPLGSTDFSCAAADLQSSAKWTFLPCETTLPFVCYGPGVPPVRRQVVKQRMKPRDSSVDLNSPAVRENILQKLQDRLRDSGVGGVTLTWREQCDGKVFHKEQEHSLETQRNSAETFD